jgi:septal ring-binding cell division protein DamX
MKIDRQQLTQLLVHKTGLDLTSIDAQLDELINRIRKAADKGKALEIKGFGLFYLTSEGELRFDPSEEFKTEVNFKYAGMDPVELNPPRDNEDKSIVEEEAKPIKQTPEFDDDPSDQTLEISHDPSDFDFEEEPEGPPKPRDFDPFSGLLGDVAARMGVDPQQGDDDNVFASDPADDDPYPMPVMKTPEIPAKAEAEKESAEKSDKPAVKKESNPMNMIIIAIVVVVLLVVGYFIAKDFGWIGSSSPVPPAPQQSAQQTPAPSVESPAPETVVPEATEREQVTLAEVQQPEPVAQNLYGLNGSVQPGLESAFTIVLYSFGSETNANASIQRLQNEGYRAILVRRSAADGSPLWRVSIGQFETTANAQQAASNLPEPYRSQNFIQRVQ